MKIGEKITQLRKEKGLFQTKLADATKASREAISKYKRGEAIPSVEVAARIADVFEVTIGFLMGKNHTLAVDNKISNACRISTPWMTIPKTSFSS